MRQVIKVALSGYNAETDTNPDHFALYVDSGNTDYVLIKEKETEKVVVNANSTTTINYGLSYIAFCLVFAEVSNGRWRKLFSTPLNNSGLSFSVDTGVLNLINKTAQNVNFSYHIFFDNIT